MIVKRYAYYSLAGRIEKGTPKINQDSLIIRPRITGNDKDHLFGVADGHGQYGKEVSSLLQNKLPNIIRANLRECKSVPDVMRKAFYIANEEVKTNVQNVELSGSTCVVVLIKGQELYTANVGDSRAIICFQELESNIMYNCVEIQARAISRDHKPDDAVEARRILQNGGRIEPFMGMEREYIGPTRVWLKNSNYPGLAMTRAIGDLAGAKAGVISEPGRKSI